MASLEVDSPRRHTVRISIAVLGSITVFAGFVGGWSAGCASAFDGKDHRLDSSNEGGSGVLPVSGPGSAECPACVTGTDCTGAEVCAQFQGDSFCAPVCGPGSTCPSG